QEGLYLVDGQILAEDYVWGSFVQSKMYANGIGCNDCHDSHSLQLQATGNELCTRCHRADTYDAYEHHFHQKTVDGKPSDGALCVKCHMMEQPFMVIDYRADHSLRVPRPDLSAELGTPNACTQSGCHDDHPLQWSIDAFTTWYGRARKPQFGTILAAARDDDPDAEQPLIDLIENTLYPAIVRATALEDLSAYADEDVAGVLRRALADEEPLVRHTAVSNAVAAGPPEAVAMLAPLLFDPVKAVRMAAASQLAGVPQSLFQPYQREALDEALAEYVRVNERSLDFTSGGLNLGNLAAARNDPQAAEGYYRAALEVDDLFYPAKMNLALLLSQQGREAEATVLVRQVVDAYPENYDAVYWLALLTAAEQPRQAVDLLRQAADAMPDNGRVRYNLGLLLQQLGEDAAAETALRQALELEPEQFDYLYALVDFYARRDRLPEALALADRIIALHPGDPRGPQIKAMLEEQLRSRR
ncbi:MAG: HEAT repeat domain-containing protein, partial [Acidobacteriota bacterium]